MIPSSEALPLTPGASSNIRSRKYRSPAIRGGSVDQGSPGSNSLAGEGINGKSGKHQSTPSLQAAVADPVRQLIRKLRQEKRDRQKANRER